LQTKHDSWEKVTLHFLQDGHVALEAHTHGTFYRAHPGGEGSKVDMQTKVGPWEQYTLHPNGDGTFSIRTAHGTYFRAHPGGEGSKVDLQTNIGPWERFSFVL
jgi:hypothetical protein